MSVVEPNSVPGSSTIDCYLCSRFNGIDLVHILRIAKNFVIILWAARYMGTHFLPCCTAIYGTEETTALTGRFNNGIDIIRVNRGNRQSDRSDISSGETRFQLLPCFSSIGCFVNGRFRTAVDFCKHMASPLMSGSINNIGVSRVHDDITYSGMFTDGKHGFPCFSPIGRFVQTALASRSPYRSFSSHIDDIGIG